MYRMYTEHSRHTFEWTPTPTSPLPPCPALRWLNCTASCILLTRYRNINQRLKWMFTKGFFFCFFTVSVHPLIHSIISIHDLYAAVHSVLDTFTHNAIQHFTSQWDCRCVFHIMWVKHLVVWARKVRPHWDVCDNTAKTVRKKRACSNGRFIHSKNGILVTQQKLCNTPIDFHFAQINAVFAYCMCKDLVMSSS